MDSEREDITLRPQLKREQEVFYEVLGSRVTPAATVAHPINL
jgi:hypothetical protein